MKTKTFMFKVSECKGLGKGNVGYDDAAMIEQPNIDTELNEFIDGCDVIDIKMTTFTSNRHNNGGTDEVWALYTIMYK